ncbi:DUF2911 domain-containing protein [bacterium]|nr:DUF2911 domain-containing protein [bacterium]
MKTLAAAFLTLIIAGMTASSAFTQNDERVSQAASISQKIGATEVVITYSRPGVKGRKIWGELVPWGEKPFPWRAGANENTTISFSTDVEIEGKKLPAGKYGLHMTPQQDQWTIIFSKKNNSWGSFKYNKDEDALRVNVKPVSAPMKEWLEYEFDDMTQTSGTINLYWEKLRVPIAVKIAK